MHVLVSLSLSLTQRTYEAGGGRTREHNKRGKQIFLGEGKHAKTRKHEHSSTNKGRETWEENSLAAAATLGLHVLEESIANVSRGLLLRGCLHLGLKGLLGNALAL